VETNEFVFSEFFEKHLHLIASKFPYKSKHLYEHVYIPYIHTHVYFTTKNESKRADEMVLYFKALST